MADQMISNLGFTSPGSGSTKPDLIRYDSMPSVYNPPQVSPFAVDQRNDMVDNFGYVGPVPMDIIGKMWDAVFVRETEDTKPTTEQSSPNPSTISNQLINQFSDNGLLMPALLVAGAYFAVKYLKKRR